MKKIIEKNINIITSSLIIVIFIIFSLFSYQRQTKAQDEFVENSLSFFAFGEIDGNKVKNFKKSYKYDLLVKDEKEKVIYNTGIDKNIIKNYEFEDIDIVKKSKKNYLGYERKIFAKKSHDKIFAIEFYNTSFLLYLFKRIYMLIFAIIFALINVVLAFLSTRFLVFAFFIPIFTAIKLWELNDKNKMIFLFTTGLFSAILNIRITIFLMSPMIIFGNVLYDLIKKNKTDKYSLKVLTIIFSVLSLTIIGYLYSKSDINLNFLVDATEKIFKDQNFKIDKEIIRQIKISLKSFISILIVLILLKSLIFSFL